MEIGSSIFSILFPDGKLAVFFLTKGSGGGGNKNNEQQLTFFTFF
jgi:hypothetical protein